MDMTLDSVLAYESLMVVTVAGGIIAIDMILLSIDNYNNNKHIPDLVIIEENIEDNIHKKGIMEK